MASKRMSLYDLWYSGAVSRSYARIKKYSSMYEVIPAIMPYLQRTECKWVVEKNQEGGKKQLP